MSGFVSIVSHTYDMHQFEEYESGDFIRTTICKLDNETYEEYKTALTEDFKKFSLIMKLILGKDNSILVYPHGKYDEYATKILKELGVKTTVTTEAGINKIEKNNADSLYNLKRYSMNENITGKELLKILKQKNNI